MLLNPESRFSMQNPFKVVFYCGFCFLSAQKPSPMKEWLLKQNKKKTLRTALPKCVTYRGQCWIDPKSEDEIVDQDSQELTHHKE